MMTYNYREASRDQTWGSTSDKIEQSDLRLGALLRMADAMELMAKSRADLEKSRDRWRAICEHEQAASARLRKSNAALRGIIRRMKAKQEALT